MQQLVILLVINCFSTCFGASLFPSSGGQTAFSLPMVFCPVVTVVMLESRVVSCVHCVELASRLSNITTATTGQKTIGSENEV